MLKTFWLWLILISPVMASEARISLAFDSAPVEQVLQALADYQQLNLMVAPGVDGVLSLRLKAVPWQQALQMVLKMGQIGRAHV